MYQLALAGTGVAIDEKITLAIERLRTFAPPDGSPYWLAFSGGKDSGAIHRLAEMAGVPFVAHLSVTTVDPPELLYHVRRHYPEVVWHRPPRPMWAMIAEKGMPPTRLARWCCDIYKETTGPENCHQVLGVRWAESARRAKRWKVLNNYKTKDGVRRIAVCPMVDWTDADVWEFHRQEQIPYCSLYDEGFKRLGCVFCPMARSRMKRDMERWPRIGRLWRKGITLAWHARKARGDLETTRNWTTPEAMWKWWIEDEDPGPAEECDGLGLFT